MLWPQQQTNQVFNKQHTGMEVEWTLSGVVLR